MIDDLRTIVRESGEKILALKKAGIFEGQWKGSQYKARADEIIHDFLIKKLTTAAPGIPVVSEEDPPSWEHINSDRYFLVDPIDGTASFAQGFPGFVTQIAYMEKGSIKSSSVCAPVSGDIFWAERNKGAFLNENRLLVRDPFRWKTLIDNYPAPRGIARDAFDDLLLEHYVECGSISLKICKIADGTADIFFKNITVQPWDIAAPQLILEESGGSIMGIDGNPLDYSRYCSYPGIVAANSAQNAKRLITWYSNLNRKEDLS